MFQITIIAIVPGGAIKDADCTVYSPLIQIAIQKGSKPENCSVNFFFCWRIEKKNIDPKSNQERHASGIHPIWAEEGNL